MEWIQYVLSFARDIPALRAILFALIRILLFYQFRNQPFMPVEFSVAAYRLGHSMVRPSYHLNEEQQRYTEAHGGTGDPRTPFRIPIFSAHGPNLNGFRPIPPKSADQPFLMEIDWKATFKLIRAGRRRAKDSYPAVALRTW